MIQLVNQLLQSVFPYYIRKKGDTLSILVLNFMPNRKMSEFLRRDNMLSKFLRRDNMVYYTPFQKYSLKYKGKQEILHY